MTETQISAPERLNAGHDVSRFSCGRPALDNWLKTYALSNQEKGFTVVMAVHAAGRVVGYYGLSPTSIVPTGLPRSIRTGQPPNPVPCLLLGQLATDSQWSGRGIGTGLLAHALARCVAGAQLIGGRALVVNALDEEAAVFWRRRGFFLPKTILSRSSVPSRTLRRPSAHRNARPRFSRREIAARGAKLASKLRSRYEFCAEKQGLRAELALHRVPCLSAVEDAQKAAWPVTPCHPCRP